LRPYSTALAEKYRQFAELMAPPVEEAAVEELSEEAAAAAAVAAAEAAEAAAAAAAASAAVNESTEGGEEGEEGAAEAEANAEPPGKTLADIEADIRRFAALAEAVEAGRCRLTLSIPR
jgi:hypothetical protein